MGRRGHTTLASVLVVCTVAVGGVIAALVITKDGHESAAPVPTTGLWAPITVTRPSVPIIGGGIPVDIDPMLERHDFSTTLTSLPGTHRYRLTMSNVSNLGAINSLQWYPPTGVHILKVVGSTEGHCILTGLTGFGGNQFPTVVLYPNILCDNLDLKPPSCTCQGDGGALAISFVTDKDVGVVAGDARMRTATLVFDRIPAYLKPASTVSSSG
jgi:hypothetical protein